MCKKWRRKKNRPVDRVEQRFLQVTALVKDLDSKEYKRLIDSIDLVWRGYQKMYQATPQEEKELDVIDDIELSLTKAKGE